MTSNKKHEPQPLTTSEVRERFDYDPAAGELIWKPRPGDDPQTKRWNSRYAGKVAGGDHHSGYRHARLRPFTFERSTQERINPFIDLAAQTADLAL